MILIVKGTNYKSLIRKVLSFVALVVMFSLYYNHMSSEFKSQNDKLAKELKEKTDKLKKKFDLTKKVERIIYKEAEKCVDLIGQERIKSIKIDKDRLIIICDWDTDIEVLFVRYGVLALVKSTPEDIKIKIDLKFIVESIYEI
ncbi:MAG: hypothetical protein KAJ49_02190 [Arcobacteraceae bacterium]|nr:hypothetical protein [Arcobacteraceae bacterium]